MEANETDEYHMISKHLERNTQRDCIVWQPLADALDIFTGSKSLTAYSAMFKTM